MAQDKPGQTLQATALVHEAWLRLAGPDEKKAWNSRGHFFGAAAEAMRRILVDRAQQKARIRHGGGLERVDLEQVTLATQDSSETVLAMNDALEALALGIAEEGRGCPAALLHRAGEPGDRPGAGDLPLHRGTLLGLRPVVAAPGVEEPIRPWVKVPR